MNDVLALSTVTISKQKYEELLDDQRQLDHLRGLGVDNWEGYSHYSWDESEDTYG
jgi:hypothetical protein